MIPRRDCQRRYSETYRPWQLSGRRSRQDVAIAKLVRTVIREVFSPSSRVGRGSPGSREKRSATYRDLKDELLAIVFRLKGVQDGRELGCVELDCFPDD